MTFGLDFESCIGAFLVEWQFGDRGQYTLWMNEGRREEGMWDPGNVVN